MLNWLRDRDESVTDSGRERKKKPQNRNSVWLPSSSFDSMQHSHFNALIFYFKMESHTQYQHPICKIHMLHIWHWYHFYDKKKYKNKNKINLNSNSMKINVYLASLSYFAYFVFFFCFIFALNFYNNMSQHRINKVKKKSCPKSKNRTVHNIKILFIFFYSHVSIHPCICMF